MALPYLSWPWNMINNSFYPAERTSHIIKPAHTRGQFSLAERETNVELGET
jgi:hypothetical protein